MNTADFDFELPADQIAVTPAARRDASRLLVMNRTSGILEHGYFHEVARHLPPRALLVLNDTRVLAARLRGHKPTGGAVELLLTHGVSGPEPIAGGVAETWEALARGLGPLARDADTTLDIGEGRLRATVLERREGGRVVVRLEARGAASVVEALEDVGEVPLPPYIESARKRAGGDAVSAEDRRRYQTVYAAVPGAVAAPTAGLHFTSELLAEIRDAGHDIATLTLHVGPGTFRPVTTDDPRQHRLDAERFHVPADTADALAAARAAGRPVVAVGTTVVRALESAALAGGGRIAAGHGTTELMILPGDRFAVVSGLITNFHLPRSTLLMLVAAFAGQGAVLAAYREAVARGYRFYSYGDAMLIRAREVGG